MKRSNFLAIIFAASLAATSSATAKEGKPNILVIWGDDIGWWNVSAYNRGMMGYKTPNIDRIANEGALFTDWYGQQSCTAGRAAFVTGHIDDHAARVVAVDSFQRGDELWPTLASTRSEYVAGQATRMHAYQRILPGRRIAHDQDAVHRHRIGQDRERLLTFPLTELVRELAGVVKQGKQEVGADGNPMKIPGRFYGEWKYYPCGTFRCLLYGLNFQFI